MINILWIQSKNTDDVSKLWADEERMQHHLRNLTGKDPSIKEENPMNWILPAYETMWRAVLTAVLEVYFRDAPDSLNWQSLMVEFLESPDKDLFAGKMDPTKLCVLDLVKEVLRLYAPDKRLGRMTNEGMLKVDIEILHKDILLAPENPLSFHPDRWIKIREIFSKMYLKEQEAEHENLDKLDIASETGDTNSHESISAARKSEGDMMDTQKVAIENSTRTETRNFVKTLKDHEADLGFLPFSTTCPAGKQIAEGFGYKMIALLAAAVMKNLKNLSKEGEIWMLENEHPGDRLPGLGEPLKAGRADYLSLFYRRVA